MKQMKHNSSKEADEIDIDEENEELFGELGKYVTWSPISTTAPYICN